MKQMTLRSLGKINLGLDVLGRLENGYHQVRMVMQSVYLFDEIVIKERQESGVVLTSNLKFLPTDDKNIAYQAAKCLLQEFQCKTGVEITLQKHIPVCAGLAGGSGNAAAVLYGLNQMFRLGLSEQELMKRGAKLGADVPYCILRGTVLAEGIGEKLTVLKPMPLCTVLLAKPPINISTKGIYEKLDREKHICHPPMDRLLRAIQQEDLRGIATSMGNVLETVTQKEYPVIAELKKRMLEGGALGALMSGSGPTVFGLFTDRRQARQVKEEIRKRGLARQIYTAGIHQPYRR